MYTSPAHAPLKVSARLAQAHDTRAPHWARNDFTGCRTHSHGMSTIVTTQALIQTLIGTPHNHRHGQPS
jgi:hypothetical protein